MRFKIKWTDCVGYETEVEANSAEEARAKFDAGEIDAATPDGFCETEVDSIEVEEIFFSNIERENLNLPPA